MGDVAATVDCAAETAPALTTTVAVWVTATELMVAETVFEPAPVDDSVPVATPLAFVVPTGCVKVLPAVGVAASETVAPSIGLRSEEHTSELQSLAYLVCRLLLEKKKKNTIHALYDTSPLA